MCNFVILAFRFIPFFCSLIIIKGHRHAALVSFDHLTIAEGWQLFPNGSIRVTIMSRNLIIRLLIFEVLILDLKSDEAGSITVHLFPSYNFERRKIVGLARATLIICYSNLRLSVHISVKFIFIY